MDGVEAPALKGATCTLRAQAAGDQKTGSAWAFSHRGRHRSGWPRTVTKGPLVDGCLQLLEFADEAEAIAAGFGWVAD